MPSYTCTIVMVTAYYIGLGCPPGPFRLGLLYRYNVSTCSSQNSLSMDNREPISVHKYNYLSMLAPTGKVPLSKHRSFFYQAFLRKYDSFKLITHFLGLILLSCQHIYTCISKEMFFCIYLVALFIETDKCSNLKL